MKPTPQELDVLRLVLLGQQNSSIAYLLGIPIGDVEAHRKELARKFGVDAFLQTLRANFGSPQKRQLFKRANRVSGHAPGSPSPAAAAVG